MLGAIALVTFGSTALSVDWGSSARAASPGQNGKLAFVRSFDIWVANANGSNPTQLTTSPGLDRSPRWSPDGTKLAFASGRGGGSKLFVMNADGSGQRQVTFTPARDRTSAWTADGTQIVYDREFAEIYAVNADGSGGERKLADGLLPGTSPYGDKVVFTASAVGLITMNLNGSARRQVTTGGADFGGNWSPGGTELVFTRPSAEDRDIYRVHANGLGLVQLTNTPGRIEVGPVWSPDGTKIAFLGCPPPLNSSDCGIYVMNRDGSGETQVPNLSASFAEAPLDWQPLQPFPDGAAPATLTVGLTRAGAGMVASTPEGLRCPPVCSADFDRDSHVRLEARPNGPLAFLGWTGACSGRSTSCIVTMDDEKRVAASFGRDRFKLTVSVKGPGRVVSSPSGIACVSRCTTSFRRGARVVLRARPGSGANFVRWGGACKGSRSCTVSMNTDRVVTARFLAMAVAPLQAQKTGDNLVSASVDPVALKEPGGQVTYSVRITNTSVDRDISITSVDDAKTGDLDDEGGSGCFDVPINMAPGQFASCQYTTHLTGTGGTAYSNLVTASGHDDRGDPVSGSDEPRVDIIARIIDLVMIKGASSPTPLNGIATYSLTITNSGPDAATNVQLADPAPFGITYLTANALQGTCNLTPSLVTCGLGSITAGETVTVAIKGRAAQVGSHTNTATVTGSGGRETNPADNIDSATTVIPQPLLAPEPPKTEACLTLTVKPKLVKADGKIDRIAVSVVAGRKPVAGARVLVAGAGVRDRARSNRRGIAVLFVNPKKAGLLTVSTFKTKRPTCGIRRIGVVAVFLPPVPG